MGRKCTALWLASLLLTGCDRDFFAPYSDSELAEAEALVTGEYIMDHDSLMFACNWFHNPTDRIDGCIQVVGSRIELYIRDGMGQSRTESQRRYLLGHVRHRVIEKGNAKEAGSHSYSNALDAIRKRNTAD